MKKLKKLILPIILLVLLCAVCVALFMNYRESRKFQPPINGISWGMTSDEIMKKLNLSQENVEKDDNGNITLHYDNANVFNQKANIKMFFDEQTTKIDLYNIVIDFQDLNKDDLVKQLNDIYGQFSQRFGSTPTWSSETVADLPTKIQDRFMYERKLFYSNSSGEFSDERISRNLQMEPLVSVELIDYALIYNADCMAIYSIAKDDEKYNEWIEYIENLYKNRPEPDSAAE